MSVRWCPTVLSAVQRRIQRLPRFKLKPTAPAPAATASREDIDRAARTAAVFVPLCNVGGEASVLFTKRSDHVGTHKGQVSFPGGHIDAGEQPEEAALRELEEELGGGIEAHATTLGMHHDVVAVTGTRVTPTVGFVDRDMEDMSWLSPEPCEVDTVFTLPLTHLTDPNNLVMRQMTYRSDATEMPSYTGGPAVVWGLTAYILDRVLRDVLLPSLRSAGYTDEELAATGGRYSATAAATTEVLVPDSGTLAVPPKEAMARAAREAHVPVEGAHQHKPAS